MDISNISRGQSVSQVKAARTPSRDSRSAILDAARSAFLEHGFQGVSLRAIAHDAGLTTGAIYGNFHSKEDLFDAVVSAAGDGLVELYEQIIAEFSLLPKEQRGWDAMGEFERVSMARLVDFMYDNYDCFRLICTCSSGTSWEHYKDRLMELELMSTIEYERTVHAHDDAYEGQSHVLLDYIVNQFIQGIFQPIVLGLSRREAQSFVYAYGCFFHEGARGMFS